MSSNAVTNRSIDGRSPPGRSSNHDGFGEASLFGDPAERLVVLAKRGVAIATRCYRRGDDIVLLGGAMMLLTFSMLERSGPASAAGADLIALLKMAARMVAIVWFAGLMLFAVAEQLRAMHRRDPAADAITHLSRMLWSGRWSPPLLIPWWVLTAWSAVSIFYSPLLTYSAGQWLGLVALLLMSDAIARRDFLHRRVTEWVVRRLFAGTSIYCLMVMAVHVLRPELSGFNREVLRVGSQGFVHPTAAGATSSLGLLLGLWLFLRRHVVLGWDRDRSWIDRMRLRSVPVWVCSMMTQAAVLLYSSSRASLGMLVIAGGVGIVFLSTRRQRAVVAVLVGCGLMASVPLAPAAVWLDGPTEAAAEYLMRGQTGDQLRQVSGRGEMWTAVWHQFTLSPIVGHGYLVTSHNGRLDVWERISNHDAHNVGLQILVSLGVVGGLIFLWAMMRLAAVWLAGLAKLDATADDRDRWWLMTLVGLWFLGWSQTCVTFMGPIRPESVIFFAVVGLVARPIGRASSP